MAIALVNNTCINIEVGMQPLAASGTFTIPATTAGNVLVAIAFSFSFSGMQWLGPNFLSANVSGVFTEVPYWSLAGQAGIPWNWATIGGLATCSVDFLYLVCAGGDTSITYNCNHVVDGLLFYEVSGLQTPVVVDDFEFVGSGTAATVVAAPLNGTHGNDLCLQNISSRHTTPTAISPPWTLDPNFSPIADGPAFLLNASGTQVPPIWSDSGPDEFTCISLALVGKSAPAPILTCAALDLSSGNPVNGVFINSLGLFIIPAWALYENLVPFNQLTFNESLVQGRHEIVLDFNNSEGLYARDLGTIFTWQVNKPVILEVWQPSVIPMDGEIYDRMSYHFLFTSLNSTGWAHVREMNLAFISNTNLNVQLNFDQGASPQTLNLVIPNSGGVQAKTKITLPPNKFKMLECFVSSTAPFKLWTEDMELKIKQWGSTESYRVVKPISG